MEDGKDYISNINSDSLTSLSQALVEKSVSEMDAEQPFQLERIGYFTVDSKANARWKTCSKRSVAMRDSWAKKTFQVSPKAQILKSRIHACHQSIF